MAQQLQKSRTIYQNKFIYINRSKVIGTAKLHVAGLEVDKHEKKKEDKIVKILRGKKDYCGKKLWRHVLF